MRVHEHARSVWLAAALVEVAGGDAVNEEPWRRRDPVLDGVPDFGGGRAGKAESVDAFEGAKAEIYPAPFAGDMGDGKVATPIRQAMVDDLGNLVFSAVPVGEYTLIIHLPGQEVVIEGVNIEHG